jgi:hypothetical protein
MRLAEPYCECTSEWTGSRCMEKALEGAYSIKISVTPPSIPPTKLSTRTKRPLKNIEHITTDCTGPHATDFCLNGGTCQKVHVNKSFGYMCICSHPYYGERCMEKVLDGTYNTRIRRSLDDNVNKTKYFRKFRLR